MQPPASTDVERILDGQSQGGVRWRRLPHREGITHACSGQRLEPEVRQHARCAHVPRIGNDECAFALVERTKRLRFFSLRGHCRSSRDNTLDRQETLAYASAIAFATSLPVSADLENGFGDAPEVVAETIRLAAAGGVVGGSIEDATGRSDHPIYDLELAVERVRAAAEAARTLSFPFTLTARAENYLHRRPDLADTIKRLQAYQDAGADVLYAPALAWKDDIAAVVRSVDRPVNVLMGLQGVQLSLAELSAMGVRRVSVGSSLARAAMGAFLRAAREMREHGTFTFASEAARPKELTSIFTT